MKSQGVRSRGRSGHQPVHTDNDKTHKDASVVEAIRYGDGVILGHMCRMCVLVCAAVCVGMCKCILVCVVVCG